MSKKYLFLLGSYLPYASANGVCVEKIALLLKNHGNDVFCLSMKRYDDVNFEEIDEIKVYRINNLWHNQVLDWCDLHPNLFCVHLYRKIALWLWRFKRIILFFLYPLSSPIFAYKYYRKSKQICKDDKIDCVIAVYQPFESLFALYFLKKAFPALKSAVYCLDSLYAGFHTRLFPTSFSIRRMLFVESKCFESFDLILILNVQYGYYITRYPEVKFINKLCPVDIPLIIKKKENDNLLLQQRNDAYVLVFAGSINMPVRDPRYMLEVLSKIHKFPCNFYIYGKNNCLKYFESKIQSLSDNIFHIFMEGCVPHKKINDLLLNADILINIANNDPRQIPSKIFEYMSFGKPIISFYKNEEDPSLPYLKKYPLALIIKEDWNKLEENAADISDFIKDARMKSVSFSTVENLFSENTPEFTAKKLLFLVDGEKSDG